ncbi:MAG: PAS domain S-box protein [Rubrivivax sp.]|nr:PAS domain S-box protein [Rubrivivax sp.]
MLLLVLAVLLPAAGVSAWLLDHQLGQARAAAEGRVKLLADETAAALQLTLRDQRSLMKRVAELPRVRALDPDNFDPGVAEYLRLHPEYNNLGVRDRDARLIFSGRPGGVTAQEEFREFPWFKEGIASTRFLAGDAFLGRLSGRWVTVLTQPVVNDSGDVIGIVHMAQDLLALNERVLGSAPVNAVVAVVDRQGHYLLRSAEPQRWLGSPGPPDAQRAVQGAKQGFLVAAGPDGVLRQYAFVTMPDTGWRVVAGVPLDEVLAEYRRLRLRGVLVGTGILLVALVLAWRIGRAIAKPVEALARAAGRVAGGDGGARAPAAGPTETRAVALQFNRMVDARAKIEAALRHSENSLAVTLQSIADAVIATDLTGRVTRMNGTAERLTGWPQAEALGRELSEVFPIVNSDTREPVDDPVRKVLDSGVAQGLANHTALLARDGNEYQIADSAAPIRDEAGKTLGVVLVFSDVTERYRAEQAEREQARVLRLRDRALAEVSQGVMLTDAQARITYVNPGFERLTGWAAAEVMGRTPRFLQGASTSPETAATISQAVRAGRAFHGEVLNQRKDGSPLWVALDISPLRDEQGTLTGFVGAQRDIGERRQAEADRRALEVQLRESQKMEAIGTLAGGIAHDFNNMLGAILGNVALARDDLSAGHPAMASLDQIRKAGDRARAMVQQILAFGRRQPHELTVQPLRPVVEETLDLLRSTLPARVALERALTDQPVTASVDATQIQQVLMNLCTNAWHALQGSTGTITVGLEEAEFDAVQGLAADALPAGRYAHLWVRDTGTGMDAATRARIFEPFFTTKPTGRGTGLGLSMVHGIVTAHGGAIRVDTARGKGSTFHLYFPTQAQAHAVPPETAAESQLGALDSAGAHVLYVDDDEVMCLVVERLLQRAGYRCTCCTNAQEALRVVQEVPEAVDIVITDYNMPSMSGLELAEALLARGLPDLPVVISSGYITDELRAGAERLGVRSLLQKQNTVEELVRLVRRVLSR